MNKAWDKLLKGKNGNAVTTAYGFDNQKLCLDSDGVMLILRYSQPHICVIECQRKCYVKTQ